MILGSIASGKSYVSNQILSTNKEIEYLCSDEYKEKLFSNLKDIDGDDTQSLKAYRCSDELLFYRISKLCRDGVDFIVEFCPTNRNKLDTIKFYARLYHYDIISYFVGTDDVVINLERYKKREASGGDPVSEEKIRSRYSSAFNSVLEIINISKTTCFIDNSTDHIRLIAIQKGNAFYMYDNDCTWFNNQIRYKIQNQKG